VLLVFVVHALPRAAGFEDYSPEFRWASVVARKLSQTHQFFLYDTIKLSTLLVLSGFTGALSVWFYRSRWG